MPIDHVDIRVSDLTRSEAFYSAALAPLGWRAGDPERDPAGGRAIEYGRGRGTEFAIHEPGDGPGQDTEDNNIEAVYHSPGTPGSASLGTANLAEVAGTRSSIDVSWRRGSSSC